jgi:hypothetical protein
VADNVELDPGTGGAVVATDQINANEHVQYVKLMDGTADSAAKIGGDATNGLDVDVTRSALPSGASTSANQTTIIGHLDGVEGLLTTIDADTGTIAGAVSGTEMQVDVLTVPADPFGANADAAATAGSTGSMQAKLRLLTSQLDAVKTAVETLDNTVAGTELQVDVVGALPAGTNNIGDVDVLTLPSIPAGTNNIGDVDVASIAAGTNAIGNVGVVPRTSGGLSIFRSLDLDETEEDVKTSAGQVFGWYFYNDGAAEAYVKFYNATAANVTVGTTTPVLTIPIPAGAAANVFTDIGIAFGTAISVAATTAVADNDTAAPAANQVVANIFYA